MSSTQMRRKKRNTDIPTRRRRKRSTDIPTRRRNAEITTRIHMRRRRKTRR